MTITTFCLAGYSGKPLDKNHLGGELFKAPFVRRDVSYDNKWFAQSNFDDGRAKAKAALLASKGQVVLLGQSMGARIVCSLLDDEDVLEKCPPSRMVAVLTGHPDRKYNGSSTVPNSGFVAAYGVDGIPDGCQYRVWDVARQYGIAEDSPTNRKITAAVKNVSSAVHGDYTGTKIGDPRNSVWRDPDNPLITYILAPTYPLPSIEAKSWWLQRKADEDAQQRPAIEKAYTRYFPAPVTTINRMFGTDIGWDGSKRGFVRMQPAAPFRPFG